MGGIRENSLKIDFVVVSNRVIEGSGIRYLSAAFDPMEKYCS